MTNTRLKVGEYEAWLVVENAEVEHYGIDVNEETKVATCWIASTAGKHFGLWMVKHHDIFDCRAMVFLDGSRTRGSFLKNQTPRLIDNASTGERTVRPFLFGVIHLTDDESVPSTQSFEELGTIKIEIDRVTDIKDDHSTPRWFQMPENNKIHERAKKAVTHQASFGQTEVVKCAATFSTCKAHEVVATFVFRYRSLELLRANEIAPREPSPTKNPATGPEVLPTPEEPANISASRKRKAIVKEEETVVETDSDEEEYQRLKAELERLRKRRLDKRPQKKVKHEQKPVFLPGEIIDLTI